MQETLEKLVPTKEASPEPEVVEPDPAQAPVAVEA